MFDIITGLLSLKKTIDTRDFHIRDATCMLIVN